MLKINRWNTKDFKASNPAPTYDINLLELPGQKIKTDTT
jgi:hypothetical protein